MADNPDREHHFLVKVLQLGQAPSSKLSVASIGQFLEEEVSRIAQQTGPARGLEEGLLFLARGWRRSEEGGVVPSTWAGIAPLQEAILTTAMTRMVSSPADEKVRTLAALLEAPVPAKLMNKLLSGAAEDDDVPPRMVLEVARPLKGRHLNDPRAQQFGKLVRVLRSAKEYPAALVAPPCLEEMWKPLFEPKFVWRNKKKEVIAKQRNGIQLQSSSLLGWALSASALDSAMHPPSQAHATEAGLSEWADLRRATRQRIDQLQRGTQIKVTAAQAQTAEMVEVMLRAGDAPRLAVLQWLGSLLTSSEPRGKQGLVMPEGCNFWPQMGHHVIDVLQHDETPVFERSMKNMLLLQALHARVQGFPTSGVSLNAFSLLLHLIKPIKKDQAVSVSPFFPLRDDVPEMLGAFQKEARFGEKEQVEAALAMAKNDPGFSSPVDDKTLFKTQIFWLAAKGVGCLLLPVAKEAFHAFSNIASAMYDKDPAQSDVAWREFLLAESALQEPEFLAQLGHFIDLTFRFLLHVGAAGQAALPPPEPGPAWHALPSATLENVLDLCDLYRDRQRKTTIPTGLFAHLEPEPMLTMLCIVMASDSHVRDPSLRGRAVKLMHRLCFAFPTWQQMFNKPPLSQHLIPCLVNVFIAVEKAIMSYYDLSYRYKYELRGPVMDLFDLALHNEGHREVLDQFSKANPDTLEKLLTQLINDTNSQTEEAIRTVKEYRENQNKDAAASAGASSSGGPGQGNHDEQVLADDTTGDANEDIYRRSRMNYKEHAKKYFGLASKTWKQLWLLCKHVAPVIVEGRTILEQLLHSSLDAQLHFLVGPEMKSIKSSPQEYEELGFNPKELIRQIVEIYLFLVRVNKAEITRIVGKDERFYKQTTFSKAVSFVRKYNLLAAKDAEDFEAFVKGLAEHTSQQREAYDQADIPDEFLCEMMADIMSDPVQFPQSKKIVDRWVAERQIMGTDRDPYANTPLKKEELIPMTDLKERIHRFAKDKGIELEGGNMFD